MGWGSILGGVGHAARNLARGPAGPAGAAGGVASRAGGLFGNRAAGGDRNQTQNQRALGTKTAAAQARRSMTGGRRP